MDGIQHSKHTANFKFACEIANLICFENLLQILVLNIVYFHQNVNLSLRLNVRKYIIHLLFNIIFNNNFQLMLKTQLNYLLSNITDSLFYNIILMFMLHQETVVGILFKRALEVIRVWEERRWVLHTSACRYRAHSTVPPCMQKACLS